MDNILAEPARIDTAAFARCAKCGETIFTETIIEEAGQEPRVEVVGSFYQRLDSDGVPVGARFPFCSQCKE